MTDSDSEVRREAFRAAGTLRRTEFAPVLIAHLDHASLGPEAAAALAVCGDAVVEPRRVSLDDRQLRASNRHRIPLVLFRIGTPAAAVALAESLLQADLVLRSQIISALNKLHDVCRGIAIDRPLIESSMIAELMGHYRSYQILGALGGGADEALRTSMAGEVERIFRLLKLLFPSIDLQNAYLGVQSSDPVTHANALEFLDNTLNPRLRSLLVPLVDSDVSVAERIAQADKFLGFSDAGV
jgi:AAA family ATP:ADP antiporter